MEPIFSREADQENLETTHQAITDAMANLSTTPPSVCLLSFFVCSEQKAPFSFKLWVNFSVTGQISYNILSFEKGLLKGSTLILKHWRIYLGEGHCPTS